jgi:predicted nucleic acid-binding protein
LRERPSPSGCGCGLARLASFRSSVLAAAEAATLLDGPRRSSPTSGTLIAVVDTGPLYAATDLDDHDHTASVEALQRPDLELVIPLLVVAEATYLVGSRLGAKAEARFLRGLGQIEVEAPTSDDWERIADLVDQYADLPLGGTDASVIALAERLDAGFVITLDRRHFTVVRPRHRNALELIPEA